MANLETCRGPTKKSKTDLSEGESYLVSVKSNLAYRASFFLSTMIGDHIGRGYNTSHSYIEHFQLTSDPEPRPGK